MIDDLIKAWQEVLAERERLIAINSEALVAPDGSNPRWRLRFALGELERRFNHDIRRDLPVLLAELVRLRQEHSKETCDGNKTEVIPVYDPGSF